MSQLLSRIAKIPGPLSDDCWVLPAAETTVATDRFGTEANATERIEFHGQSIEVKSRMGCGTP